MILRRLMLSISLSALCLTSFAGCSQSQTPEGVSSVNSANTNVAANSSSPVSNGNSNASGTSAPPQAPQHARVVYILDASGSMLGRVGKEEKMAAARRVMKESIAKLPDNAEVGLIAYGHRRKNDCADIEVLSQFKPIDKQGLGVQIDALKPSGMTPITNSLQQAFEVVRAQQANGAVTVVLVSDGLETCQGDPCKLAADAKKAGLNFVLHVIGFDVGKISVAQLECVAQAGGGLYLGAQNADELSAALAGAVTPPVLPDSRLSIKAVADGQLTDVVVTVRRAGSGEAVTSGRTYDAIDTNPRVLPLAAGDYDVTVTAVKLSGAPSIKFDGVKIGAGQTVERTADFSAGQLSVEVVRNGRRSEAVVQVFASGKTDAVANGRTSASSNPFVFRVLPGKYDVLVKSIEIAGGPTIRLTDVVVEGAKQVTRTADFSTGSLRVGAVRGSELVDAVVIVTNLATNKDDASLRTYATANTNPRVFELLPGRYRVRLSPVKPAGLKPQEIEIEIKAGLTAERSVDFAR
jgi:Ca-activated chloride channel homolog